MTLRLDPGTAGRVVARHESAAEEIDASAASAPGTVDGGYGSAYVSEILAAIATTAGEIAVINAAVASQVRDATDDVGLTEVEVAQNFASINRNLS